MLSAPAAVCTNHKKRERVTTCGVCGSSLCLDCVVHTAVGVKCRKCTGGAAATAPTASRQARGQATEGQRRRWAAPVAVMGALLIVVAAAAVFTRGGGGSSDEQVAGGGEPDVALTTGNGAFIERNGDFTGAGGTRVGATLTIPANLGNGRAPGVLIVPGGGAQDRNGGITLDGSLPDPLYQDLAEAFAEAGMVSLRYDRRGSPALVLGQGIQLSWDDLLGDAQGGLEFLAERRETEGQPLIVVGYDQGGFIAMRLGATDPRVKGLVLISTPARPMSEVIAFDFQRGIPDPAKGEAVAATMREAAAQVVATGTVPPDDTLPAELQPIFRADLPYLRGLFSFDPLAEGAKVKVPTLLVRGGNDASILPEDVEALKGAIAGADELVSRLGSNTLTLPRGQEGHLHNPSRHGTVRDGDAEAAIIDWMKLNVRG